MVTAEKLDRQPRKVYDVKLDAEGSLLCDEDACIVHGHGTAWCPLVSNEHVPDDMIANDQERWWRE